MTIMTAAKHATVKTAAIGLFFLIVAAFVFLLVGHPTGDAAVQSVSGKWTCSMCPQFILPEPGKCPKCYMDLIPLEEGYAGNRLEIGLTPEAVELAGIEVEIAEKPLDGDVDQPVRIPWSAILQNLGRSFVYTESTDGEYVIFSLREIVPGRRHGDLVEVLSGLDEGEAVVSAGAFRVDSAMQIQGKISLVTLPEGDLADAAEEKREVFQPAEKSDKDLRALGVPLDRWFQEYESIRAALAKNDLKGTDAPSRLLVRDVDPDASPGAEIAPLIRRIAAAAGRFAEADGLDARRDAFDKLSADMTYLARRYGAPKGGLNLIFCPMAFGGEGAYWLQPGETVDNPYHGLEMPLCGWQVDAITE